MQLDADALPAGSARYCDVCVIGAGAAGITIARELINSTYKTVILEGGGFAWSEQSQNSYKVEGVDSTPDAFDDLYPEWSRLRYFGGSTNHWGGWCRPFDEQDFAPRPWVRNSGWPIQRSDLAAYYEQAARYVQIDPFDLQKEMLSPDSDADCHATAFPLHGEPDISARYFRYSPPTRFGALYRPDLSVASNIELIINGNAIRFDTDGDSTVQRIVCKNSKGEEFRVYAKQFILACGGLENPRLLLNSDHQRPGGLGNQHDMVGRCFMEHPHTSMGLLVNTQGSDWHLPFTDVKGTLPMRILTTSKGFQELNQLMNYSCELQRSNDGPIDEATGTDFTKFCYAQSEIPDFIRLYTRSEMAPEMANRVTLGAERDRLGLRRLKLKVNFGSDDLHSIVKSTEAVLRILSAQGLGRGKITLEADTQWSPDLGGGCHHMGTTRMSDDPSQGVVDRNCKIHDLQNMYVAGSSVFSTSSYANPTLTLVALALRLTDHLRGVL